MIQKGRRHGLHGASMRPGLNRPGNSRWPGVPSAARDRLRFNEARAESPGKCKPDRGAGSSAGSGAASMRPGLNRPGNAVFTRPEHARTHADASMRPGLNRPGNHVAVDAGRVRPDAPNLELASMRPGLNRPGNSPARSGEAVHSGRIGFNEARAESPGKYVEPAERRRLGQTVMRFNEARAESPGKSAWPSNYESVGEATSRFNEARAESPGKSRHRRMLTTTSMSRLASMRPGLNRPGNVSGTTVQRDVRRAPGPRFNEARAESPGK